jgi:hypothetical protein
MDDMKKILFAIGAAFLLIAVPACAQTSSAVGEIA